MCRERAVAVGVFQLSLDVTFRTTGTRIQELIVRIEFWR